MIMKQFSILFLCLSLASMLWAQGRPTGRGSKGMPYAQRPAIGSLAGVVKDSLTAKPVPYAMVSLVLMRSDSVVAGGLTDEKGRFALDELRPAIYVLQVESLGYKKKRSTRIMLSPRNPRPVLPDILLLAQAAALEEVEITAQKEFVELAIDRKVYHTEKVLTAQGGTTVDLLENIPSVEVDMDGNISLRGSGNVNILIDGRPSGLTGPSRDAILEQIPAASVERIEVITNPSAKYDPDGMVGIINVVLKKNKRLGLNGNLSLSVGSQGAYQNSPDFGAAPNKYQAALGLNLRNAHHNLYLNYSRNHQERFMYGESLRDNLLLDERLEQQEDGMHSRKSDMLRAGVDFYLGALQTLSLGASWNHSIRARENDSYNHIQDFDDSFKEAYRLDNISRSPSDNLDLNLNYERKFKREGQKLDIGGRWSKGNHDDQGDFLQYPTDQDSLPAGEEIITRNTTDGDSRNLVAQVDYVHPFHKKLKLETGYKSILRRIDTDFYTGEYDQDLKRYIEDPSRSNHFLYDEDIHAAYLILGAQLGKVGLQGGLRAEQAFTTSRLVESDELFENDYFSLFPSAYFTYKLSEKQELQLSYSRRINRPRTRQLNPFIFYTDPRNLRVGNPFLRPEYSDAYELGYQIRAGKHSLTPSLYFRNTRDVINRLKVVDSLGISTTSYQNLSTARSYGLELIYSGRPADWWTLNGSMRFFRNEIDGGNIAAELNNSGLGWGGRLMSTFKLPKSFTVQLSGFYRGPRQIAQGEISDFFMLSASVQKRFWNDKASLSLQLRDLFDTMRFSIASAGETFVQESLRKRESRMLQLSFSYRFGKQQWDRRRRGRGEGDGDFEVELD